MDQDRIATFVQESTGERVVTLDRVAAGYSRATFIAHLANGDELVARLSLADAPLAGTEITLDREARPACTAHWRRRRLPRRS